ncbi:ABC transporter permease [Billgrantia lactosivorans]|uniref:ABC transporter permease n=1 Tax=Billgrantia lactosivorans TaxID=2185141 RepID=UPI000DAEA03B|nr:ABC transporter permease [Halomonas lactosivorans]
MQPGQGTYRSRSAFRVTWSVWRAMFLREALGRITGDRFGWFWMFLEPIAHVLLMVAVRELLGRMRFIVNADFIPWLIVGLMTFFLFREGVTRGMNAIEANRALFAYRQVKPVDPVLVRGFLEGMLKSLVFILLLLGATFLGLEVLPFDPLTALWVWAWVWLLGLGLGLVLSVCAALVPEVAKVVRMIMFPLYFLSGVMIPPYFLPHALQQYLLYNPILHGVERMRLAFFEGYHTINGIDLLYLQLCTLCTIALGLAMHQRFAQKVLAK